MTIPYPKREFLNDDDSDSKSSAAKVMRFFFSCFISGTALVNTLKHVKCRKGNYIITI